MKYCFIFIIVSLGFSSCLFFNSNDSEDRIIAEVDGVQLKHSTLKGIIALNTSREDSVIIAENFINEWIKEQLLYQKAIGNITDTEGAIETQVRQYRKSLFIYEYKKAYLRQNLDSIIGEEEIENYYNDHKAYFQLRDYALRVLYVAIPSDDADFEKVRQWCQLTHKYDLVHLEEYCSSKALKYYLGSEDWIYLDKLLDAIPLREHISNKAGFLRQNKFFEFSEAGISYFIHILDFTLDEGISPIELVQEEIKRIVLNERKNKLLAKLNKEILQEGNKMSKYKVLP